MLLDLIDLINFQKVRKAVIYLLIMLALILLQNTVFSVVAPLGVHALFVPLFVVAVASFEGCIWGGAFGLVTGFFLDISMGYTAFFVIFLPLIGYVYGVLMEHFFNRRFFSFFFLGAAVSVVIVLLQIFRPLFILGSSVLPLLLTGILQVLWTMPFTILIYYPCRAVALRFQKG